MSRPFALRIIRRIEKILTSGQGKSPFGEDLPRLTSEQLEEVRRYFGMPKFFILGYPRSGKTLLARLIGLHPEVHCDGHAHLTRDLVGNLATPEFEAWLEGKNNHWTQGQNLMVPVIRLVGDYVMEREAFRLGKKIVGDESPNPNPGFEIRKLHAIFPDARLLHVVRDGRDAVLWRRVRQFVYLPQELSRSDLIIRDKCRRDAGLYINGQRSIFNPNWLENSANEWATHVHTTDSLASSLFQDRYIVMQFEDLLKNPIESMHTVWNFLGAAKGDNGLNQMVLEEIGRDLDAKWREEEEPELVRNLKPGLEGGWRTMYTDEDRRLFERIAGEELTAWGYEVAGD
jgi:hypothetical protein